MTPHTNRKIALVGLGPRGIGALEALADLAARDGLRIEADLFDPSAVPGAGPNFDPGESPLCRLNIPMRDIELRAPDSLAVTPLDAWLDPPVGPDAFPERARIGSYLAYRFAALQAAPGLALTRIAAQVTDARRENGAWHLQTDAGWRGPYAEVLIVPGQPATEPDAQLAGWRRHAGRTAATLASAYPARRLQRQAEDWAGRTVAVRGFALSFFDVLRVLTQGLGGRFSERGYLPSGREPARILPFSLDGQPPAPKPETRDVDRRFDPKDAETDAFRAAISAAMGHPVDQARRDVNAALIPPLHRILDAHGARVTQRELSDWLESEWTSPGSQDGTDAVTALRDGIAMAEGRLAPSIGFVVGQLWRKWQNPLRQTFNPAPAATPETAAALVAFDEGLKRYSYGPPVAACREVLALIEADIVSVDFSGDPDITPVETGWRLQSDGAQVTATVIVDAVLPSPDPQKLTDPLLTSLMRQGWLTTREALAGRTTGDGRLLDSDDRPAPGLALLGRLATGSVIAADSLHDCFGMASRRWADGVITRLV